jgi:hypothetical protein
LVYVIVSFIIIGVIRNTIIKTFAYDTKLNKEEQQIFKNHYIDLMSLIVLKNGRYPVFTPDHKFYSHDCIHVTEAGAKHFSRLIKIRQILTEKNRSHVSNCPF